MQTRFQRKIHSFNTQTFYVLICLFCHLVCVQPPMPIERFREQVKLLPLRHAQASRIPPSGAVMSMFFSPTEGRSVFEVLKFELSLPELHYPSLGYVPSLRHCLRVLVRSVYSFYFKCVERPKQLSLLEPQASLLLRDHI